MYDTYVLTYVFIVTALIVAIKLVDNKYIHKHMHTVFAAKA